MSTFRSWLWGVTDTCSIKLVCSSTPFATCASRCLVKVQYCVVEHRKSGQRHAVPMQLGDVSKKLYAAKLNHMYMRLGAEDRKYLMFRAIDYVNQYNEEFTLEQIAQIERQTLKEDELIMPMFRGILEREREGLIQQGIEQGIERGIQQSCEEIAAELIREGMGDSAVCRITRLAAERVAEIRRNNSS